MTGLTPAMTGFASSAGSKSPKEAPSGVVERFGFLVWACLGVADHMAATPGSGCMGFNPMGWERRGHSACRGAGSIFRKMRRSIGCSKAEEPGFEAWIRKVCAKPERVAKPTLSE
jgi:hypothetical protein